MKKLVIEKHPDGYVAYPLGGKGIIVGQGDTHEEALANLKSAIRFHEATFAQMPNRTPPERVVRP